MMLLISREQGDLDNFNYLEEEEDTRIKISSFYPLHYCCLP